MTLLTLVENAVRHGIKTTFMRMVATLAHPDEGAASVIGHDLATAPDAVRASIAMTGQFASFDEDLTGRENLVLLARLWGFRGRAARERADHHSLNRLARREGLEHPTLRFEA